MTPARVVSLSFLAPMSSTVRCVRIGVTVPRPGRDRGMTKPGTAAGCPAFRGGVSRAVAGSTEGSVSNVGAVQDVGGDPHFPPCLPADPFACRIGCGDLDELLFQLSAIAAVFGFGEAGFYLVFA